MVAMDHTDVPKKTVRISTIRQEKKKIMAELNLTGKQVSRRSWIYGEYWHLRNFIKLTSNDIYAEDWFEVED
jgi:hypothetical protein